MQIKIFLSHAWADKEHSLVKQLMTQLQEHHEVWVDKEHIDFGENIRDKVEEAIQDCNLFIVAWSRHAADSDDVTFELKTATDLKKIIVPCMIDDFSPEESPYLRGLKHIQLTGNALNDYAQMRFLNNFLIRLNFELTDTSDWSDERKAEWNDLKARTGGIKGMLGELEDIFHRMKRKQSGNDSSDPYLQSALGALANMLGDDGPQSKMLMFAKRMKEVSASYPDKKDDDKKQRLMLQAIYEIDPDGEDQHLTEMRQLLEQKYGKGT